MLTTRRKLLNFRICLDFTANKFYVILFSLFEALFTIFTLFVLANRPLFIFNEDRLDSLSIVSELTCARWHYPCCDQTVQIYSRHGMKASVATTEASASQRSATCRPHLSTKLEIKSKQIFISCLVYLIARVEKQFLQPLHFKLVLSVFKIPLSLVSLFYM